MIGNLIPRGRRRWLRIGETLRLPVGGVDFPRRQLSVTQQAVTVKRVTTIDEPKTRTSVRTIPLGDAVLAELAVCHEGRTSVPTDLLVADKDGAPIPQNRFSQTWARAVRRVGLPAGTRFHDPGAYRRQRADRQAHLGHKSPAITLDVYSHLWPQDDDRARAALQNFLTGDAVSSVCHDEATG